MGLFDWVEMGSAAAGAKDPGNAFTAGMEKYFPGSYTVTMGDSLTSIILGGQQYHIYGDNIQYTVDWEELLGQFLPSSGVAGGIATAILGGGGAMNFVYGRNAAAIYGPTTTIQRGATASVTGVNPVFTHGHGGLKPPAGSDQQDVDTAAAVAIGVLSLVMILVGLAIEVAASLVCFVPMEPPPEDGDSTSPPPPPPPLSGPATKYKEASELISWSLTSRLMGIILLLEQTSKDLRTGVGRTPDIGQKVEDAEKAIAKINSGLVEFAEGAADAAGANLKNAAAAIDSAAKDVALLIQDVAGLQATMATKVNTADFNNLMLAQWSVISAGKVSLISAGDNTGVEVGATGAASPISLSSSTAVNISSSAAQMAVTNGTGITMDVGSLGSITHQAGTKDVGSNLAITPAKTTLQVGPPIGGAYITVSEGEIQLVLGGPEGASISLTPAAITMKVGTATKVITAQSITEEVDEVSRELTGEGHNFTAAETEKNISPEGETTEAPTVTTVSEGANSNEQSIGDDTTDSEQADTYAINTVD